MTSAPTTGVLICDDVDMMRTLLREAVEMQPSLHVVGEARDGDEAVAEARRLQPDVILLDLSMPERTGLNALPEIVQVAPAAKIIVLSGFVTSTIAEDVRALGAHQFLEKGTDIVTILDAIEAVVTSTVP